MSLHRTGNTFIENPPTANGQTTIDGYVFWGMPYYDPDESKSSAVGIWLKLYADPNYQALPPVTSVSVDTTVTGTVAAPAAPVDVTPEPAPEPTPEPAPTEPAPEDDNRSSWGRHGRHHTT